MIDHNGAYPDEPTTSQRATAAMVTRRQVDRQMDMAAQGAPRLNDSLERALKDMPPVVQADRDGNRNKYVSLKALVLHVHKYLRDNDLRMSFTVDRTYGAEDGGGKTRIMVLCLDLTCTRSGDVARYTYEVPIPKMDPQGMASAYTYGRRMLIEGTFGLAPSDSPYDDDGESAKAFDLKEDVPDSDRLMDLRASVDEHTSSKSLNDWIKKNGDEINKLSDAEKERFRVHYRGKLSGLLSAKEDGK